jgi:hypothetical protein
MAGSFPRTRRWAGAHAERLIYRIAGLPVAVAALVWTSAEGPAAALRAMYAAYYWHPTDLSDFADMLLAGLIWPAGLIGAAGWFALKNGAVVRDRCGKSRRRQFVEQIRAYFSGGILPPWYYMFELYDERTDCRSYLNRFEAKQGYYPIIRKLRGEISALNDKIAFAEVCRAHQLRTIRVLATASAGRATLVDGEHLPPSDLFVKPAEGRGGKGTERWDYKGQGRYQNGGEPLDEAAFLDRLGRSSHAASLIVQPRLTNCAELHDINNDALSTLRIVTCLDEEDRPQVVAGVIRMAIGDNHKVDNFHAGGIAAAVDLPTGKMSSASDLGMDSRMGWVDRHPDTGARIRGRIVPEWQDACALARSAHGAFPERAVIGWDIAPTEDGPVIVEGNAAPDFDIVQRMNRSGLAEGRLGELLLHHMKAGNQAAHRGFTAGPAA